MPKKENKLSTSEQIVLVVFTVGVFLILKNIAELYVGITGVLVWVISGAIGGAIGWLALKIFRLIRKR